MGGDFPLELIFRAVIMRPLPSVSGLEGLRGRKAGIIGRYDFLWCCKKLRKDIYPHANTDPACGRSDSYSISCALAGVALSIIESVGSLHLLRNRAQPRLISKVLLVDRQG